MGATLQIIFPETYPDTVPEINIFNLKNLNNQLCAELRQKCEDLAQEYIGSQMVYNLASAVQEWLLEKNDERMDNDSANNGGGDGDDDDGDAESKMSAYEKMMLERQREQQELQKMNRYTLDSSLGKGTPVTHENFKEWKLRFDEERRQVRELLSASKQSQTSKQQSAKELVVESRLTGREWFEQKSKWFTEGGVEEEEPEEVDIDDDLFLDEDGDDDDEDDE